MLPVVAQEPPLPIATEFLTGRAVFPDDVDMRIKIRWESGGRDFVKVEDPSHTVVARFTVQPGAQFPCHTHAGPVVVNVVEGSWSTSKPRAATKRSTRLERRSSIPATGTSTPRSPLAGKTQPSLSPCSSKRPAEGPFLIPADAPAECVS
jgi:hypothetical protein